MGSATSWRLPWVVATAAVLHSSLVSGFSFSTNTPTQCQDFTVTWNGGQAPYHLVLVPVEEVEGGHIANVSIPSSASGSYTYKLDQPAGLKFLATMYDSRGWGTGGTTGILTVGSSSDSSCVPSSSSLQYDFMFSINPQNSPGQCSSMSISWDNKVTAPVNLYGLIPSGSAFQVDIPQGSPYSTSWNINIAQGTQFLLLMSDNGPHQTGGSTNLLTVGGGSGSCLDSSSPRVGGGGGGSSSSSSSAAASSTSASATSSSSAAAASFASTSGSASASSSATSSASASSSASGTASASSGAASASVSAGAGSAGIAGQGGSSSGGSDGGSLGNGGSSSTNLGAIIGGVVGGVVALGLLGLLLFCCLRRKRRSERRGSATDPVVRDYGVATAGTAALSEKPRRGFGGRGRANRYSMAGVAAASAGRRNDTDDETGEGTTDDESSVGHAVEMADPQYRASPFTASQSHGPDNGHGSYAGSPYSPVSHADDSWGTGVLAAAGMDAASEKRRYSHNYSPRTSQQYTQHDTPTSPYLPPGAAYGHVSQSGDAASVARGNSIRKDRFQPDPASVYTPSSPTPNRTSVGDTQYVQHEDAGRVVDLPPRYDQLRARNPDP